MNIIRWPEPLEPGDKVALTAPSSPVPLDKLKDAVESIKFLGLEPVIMPSCKMTHGYLAGSDKQRAVDINSAFADKNIKGIFCLRGGYGAMRILPYLDLKMIKNNPKVFAGYSDITALHTVFNNDCGFITFHAPMPNTGYKHLDKFTLDSLKASIFHQNVKINNPSDQQMDILLKGSCEGIITGGNLSLLAGTLGSPYEIDTRGKILFIEEVGELPYRIDKYLTSLALAGKFRDCSGIILGAFADCDETDPDKIPESDIIADSSLDLDTIIKEVILPWGKPVVDNLRVGHIYPQSTLPMGCRIKMDLNCPNNPEIIVL